jgi:outer membrane protein assembly factor BamB
LRLENEPYNNQDHDETRLLTNSPAHHDEHDLPPGWFTATDPQSGEEYYVNEQTGETTWDKPLPQNTNHTPLLSNQPASEDETSLASGWFAVVEPVSGDIYYANEQTGATSWEKPRKQANTSNHLSLQSFGREPQHDQSSHGLSKMNLSMHENTVYEGDSVTSSQY